MAHELRTVQIPPLTDGIFYHGLHLMHGAMEGVKADTHGRKVCGGGRMDTGHCNVRVRRMDHAEDAGSRTIGAMEKDRLDNFYCGVFCTAGIGTGMI